MQSPPTRFVQTRINNVKRLLPGLGVDALLVTHSAHKGYLSGFTTGNDISPAGYILIPGSSGPPHFITGGTDYEECLQQLTPAGYEVVRYSRPHNTTPDTELVRLAGELGIRTLGVQAGYCTLRQFESWKTCLRSLNVTVHAIDDALDDLRSIKDDWEIGQIRSANELGRQALEHVLTTIRPGQTERQVASDLEHWLKLNGSGSFRLAFQTIVVSGPRSSMPHGSISLRRLEPGDLVTIDFGPTCNGYCADITRTFTIGPASPKQREVYRAVADAQRVTIDLLGPGRPRREAAAAGVSVIRKRGFQDQMVHGAGGHGLGIEIPEQPSTDSDGVWKPGHVVTIEPGIYIPGWGGVRIEDNVAITATGHDRLTSIPTELMEL